MALYLVKHRDKLSILFLYIVLYGDKRSCILNPEKSARNADQQNSVDILYVK